MFKINNGGKKDIEKHCQRKRHLSKSINTVDEGSVSISEITDNISQNEITVSERNNNSEITDNYNNSRITDVNNNNEITFSLEEEVERAEIIQALKVVESNYSYASVSDDAERFCLMFPDSKIAKRYKQSRTKVNYVIQYGIAPYIKDLYIKDFSGLPFVFKFDETATAQVKKQYDAYIQYWSRETNLVNCVYIGSSYVGHCFAKDLLQKFKDFSEEMNLDQSLLLQLGMDGPNVNTRFEKDLLAEIDKEYGVNFLKLGSCSLHITHNGVREGIKAFGFDIEIFVNDVCFFFKLSAARRQDYKLTELFTEIETQYFLKHSSCRWLSMKKPVLRMLDQWENLVEYFLKFLPKQDNFSKQIKATQRYKRIVRFLKSQTSKAELCFIAYIAYSFEEYLCKMQSSHPMIHCLYEQISSLMFKFMKNFVEISAITTIQDEVVIAKQGIELASVDIERNQKKLELIEIGSKAKSLLNEMDISSENKRIFRKKCMSLYVTSTKYLIRKLPISNVFLKDAQYLHPEKRLFVSSASAISRIAHEVTCALKNNLKSVFHVSEYTTIGEVVDEIKYQWQLYQLTDIPKEWYLNASEEAEREKKITKSYWRDIERNWIEITPDDYEEIRTVRIDSYWAKVIEMKNSDGGYKFHQLGALIKSVLILSHGNAGPEQGFSINKSIIAAHGTRIGEENLVALRRTKHRLIQLGGVCNFRITKDLLESVNQSRRRYVEAAKKNDKSGKASKSNNDKCNENTDELSKIENEIRLVERGIEVADKAIKEGSKKLEQHLSTTKKLNADKLQSDNALIQMGLKRKNKLNEDLSSLKKKKKKLEENKRK